MVNCLYQNSSNLKRGSVGTPQMAVSTPQMASMDAHVLTG
jgi:hypothetical protein